MASQVKGLDRLRRQLRALPNSVRAAMADELAAASADLADAIRRAAPERDGDLRRSVGWCEGDPPPTKATGAFRFKPRKPAGLYGRTLADAGLRYSIYAGDAKAYYARWVEFGTAARAAQAPRRNRKFKRTVVMTRAYRAHAATPAQPFFFVTIRAQKKRLKSRVVRATNKAAKAVRDLK